MLTWFVRGALILLTVVVVACVFIEPGIRSALLLTGWIFGATLVWSIWNRTQAEKKCEIFQPSAVAEVFARWFAWAAGNPVFELAGFALGLWFGWYEWHEGRWIHVIFLCALGVFLFIKWMRGRKRIG